MIIVYYYYTFDYLQQCHIIQYLLCSIYYIVCPPKCRQRYIIYVAYL